MSARVSPASRRASASRCWCGVSFGLRPSFTPLATARARPSPVLARINSRSNSASPPRTVSISRPCGVVVSAHASPSDRNPAPCSPILAKTFNRSRVERARRSNRVTITVSPCSTVFRSFPSSGRSARAPLTFSRKILVHPADFSCPSCASSDCPSVLTLAQYGRLSLRIEEPDELGGQRSSTTCREAILDRAHR